MTTISRSHDMERADGRQRVIIENLDPEIDCGRFPIKRTVDENVEVEVDVFTDGHDMVEARLLYRHEADPDWHHLALEPLGNDRWRASFPVDKEGVYFYTVCAWVDHFLSWHRDMRKRLEAGQDPGTQYEVGARLVEEAVPRADDPLALDLMAFAAGLRGDASRATLATSETLLRLMKRYPDRTYETRYPKELSVRVDRTRARFSSWYELFPRSTSGVPGRHGSFRDVAAHLTYVASMGFDVLYFPPIHPIGLGYRKGRNNNVVAQPGEPGSPWAIGGSEGGHKDLHPDLGSLEDFRFLLGRAKQLGLEIALDIAFQCSPDHPLVKEHPEWFKVLPDGTIQYAENPPKKYQDIYPFNFESEEWSALWDELVDIVRYWTRHGVRIFRVDNPHTKPLPFWEFLISTIKRETPDALFLSEAFTRPKVMYHLAKAGFTQSYNYFPWRNTRAELTSYFEELETSGVREFFRPNLWPNTPDILTETLQTGGRPAFMIRFVLAATLGASYGIYGPVFELCEATPREEGSEEYLDSEKYEIRQWDLDRPGSLRELVAIVNRIRKENPALQFDRETTFHKTTNEHLLAYSKTSPDGTNTILVVINLDPHHVQAGLTLLSLAELGVIDGHPFQVQDLLTGAHYPWRGSHNFVQLNPHFLPAHIFRVRRHIRSERDFDYYF